MMRRCFAGLLFFFYAILVLAQTPIVGQSQFRQLDIKDGLPNQLIFSIAQDKQGYIWIGTKDGLARYDGSVFKVFRHIPGDQQSLPSNSVQMVHVDAKNRIWVGVEGFGLLQLNPDTGVFTTKPLLPKAEGSALDIWAMASDAQGSVWIGTYGKGLFRLKPDGMVQHFLPKVGALGLPDENVLSLAHDAKGVLWIATSSGVVKWQDERFIAFNNDLLSSKVVISLMPDPKLGMWLGTQSDLNRVSPEGFVDTPDWASQLSNANIMATLLESNGARWFVSSRGLNRLQNNQIEIFNHDANFVTAFQDRDGGFWFGSEQGLLRQPESWRFFKTYLASDSALGLHNKIPSNYQALDDGSVLFVGRQGSIDRFWPKSQTIKHIEFQSPDAKPKYLSAVLQDTSGQLWIGSRLELMRLKQGAVLADVWNTQSNENPSLLGPAKHMLQTPDGLIWISFYGGGIQARNLDGSVVHSITPKSQQGLKFPDPEQLFIGPDKNLWLVGGEGVLRWSPAQNRFIHVTGSPNERVFSAHLVAPQTLWLGRLGALDAFQWHSAALSKIRTVAGDEGLPAVEVSGIASDPSGALWLTSSRGLMRYDPLLDRIRIFGINDGLISQEFDMQAPYIGGSGHAFALSKGGVVGFNPSEMAAMPVPLRLVIEQISVRRDEDQLFLNRSNTIVLKPEDRDLTIEAILLNFDDVNAHRYRSRLSGYDPDWVEMGLSGKRVFSKLPYGDFRLELIATSAEAVWSEPVVLNIKVLPPLWRTWWAYALYILALLTLVWVAMYSNRRRLKRKHQQQLELQEQHLLLKGSEAKSQFLANLGHEIRTPMTGVLGMAELLLAGELQEKPKSQVSAIKKAGEHLLRLMNDALDLSKIEAGQFELDPQTFHLPSMLQDVQSLLSPLAASKNLRFECQIEPDVHQHYLGDSGRIRQILLNLGNNAIKFTSTGFVILKAQRLWPKGLMISVIDSGPGMKQEQQQKLFQRFVQADGVRTAQQYGGSGLGLAISKELALLMDGDIQLSSEPGHGSTFTLNVPLQHIENAQHAEIEMLKEANILSIEPKHILLVEDDETILQVISQLLVGYGHKLCGTKNALEALAQTANHRFDLVFCDIDLPGMSGLELAKLWRSQGMRGPIVALTARTQADIEQLCREAGMNAFLRKPISGQQLQQTVILLTSD
jgi:signal transduction histidine kinase/ligand-binding sensor domain-containing protein